MFFTEISDLKKTLSALQQETSVKALLLLMADAQETEPSELQSLLSLNNKPLLGGIFPELIANGERQNTGFLLMPLHHDIKVVAFNNQEASKMSSSLTTEVLETGRQADSVFCFVNALWSEKSIFMDVLYNALGPMVNYLGGGAGSLSFTSFPCIFANQSIIEHGAVIGLMNTPFSIGVAHGWHAISEPIKVTETQGNTIVSLNWKPAFEVYKAHVKEHANQTLTADNFFDVAKAYPLGLLRLDDEMIVRDPYATEKGHLYVVDKVPEGDYIRIMHGSTTSLLEGARNAVVDAYVNEEPAYTQFCIDCISRVLFMKNDFNEELKLLNTRQKANGIISIGEIANPTQTALELFNKTVVVAQWENN